MENKRKPLIFKQDCNGTLTWSEVGKKCIKRMTQICKFPLRNNPSETMTTWIWNQLTYSCQHGLSQTLTRCWPQSCGSRMGPDDCHPQQQSSFLLPWFSSDGSGQVKILWVFFPAAHVCSCHANTVPSSICCFPCQFRGDFEPLVMWMCWPGRRRNSQNASLSNSAKV